MTEQQKILRVFNLIAALKRTPGKTIPELSKVIDASERTIYRYFDLLTDLEFDIVKDAQKRYTIENDGISQMESFSKEEYEFLDSLIKRTKNKSSHIDLILQKIKFNSDTAIISEDLQYIKRSKILENIKIGIETKTPICLLQYHSFNSNTISDRYVEPFGFTRDGQSLICYEPIKKENKFFKLDRIGKVDILSGSFKHEDKHEIQEADIFGYAFIGKTIELHYELSVRAYLQLVEQYPQATAYITKKKRNKTYDLKVTVAQTEPFERFLKSLNPLEFKTLKN